MPGLEGQTCSRHLSANRACSIYLGVHGEDNITYSDVSDEVVARPAWTLDL
jgi:7-cyano-7-deazaguanine synthase in queuosine biosynthesis